MISTDQPTCVVKKTNNILCLWYYILSYPRESKFKFKFKFKIMTRFYVTRSHQQMALRRRSMHKSTLSEHSDHSGFLYVAAVWKDGKQLAAHKVGNSFNPRRRITDANFKNNCPKGYRKYLLNTGDQSGNSNKKNVSLVCAFRPSKRSHVTAKEAELLFHRRHRYSAERGTREWYPSKVVSKSIRTFCKKLHFTEVKI